MESKIEAGAEILAVRRLSTPHPQGAPFHAFSRVFPLVSLRRSLIFLGEAPGCACGRFSPSVLSPASRPDFSRYDILIVKFVMGGAERNPNRYIRDYVQSPDAAEWKHRARAAWLYDMSQIIGNVFYAPRTEDDPPVPDIVIGIDHMRIDTYAAYHLVPNALGIKYQITFNDHHIDRPEWALLETLTHEMGHVVQEEIFQNGSKPPYHNAVFVGMMEELGIHPKLGEGYHVRPADRHGQFGRLMDILEVAPPPPVEVGPDFILPPGVKSWWDADKGKPKGKSTLALYTSDQCQRDPVCKLRSGRTDLTIVCTTCNGQFRPQSTAERP